ncbi:MAG: energy-coupling factor transporter ATPase [Bacillales bacterium]|nr:energy-coupling factor transporter ATPase [Bacillales bacterium]
MIVKNLSYKYEDEEKNAVNALSFTIENGEWVSIIGHNGSGKSTLAKLLMGLLEKKEGEIYIEDLPLNENNLYEIRKHLGIVFQNPDNQFVATSVEDDIAFGLENLEVDPALMEGMIDSALSEVNMTNYKKSEPYLLSGGQKQRVAIAGILAMNPEIIILDEATSMLDPEGKEDFINVVKKLKEKGKIIIMITHDMNEALLSDRTIVMSNGEILKDGKTEEIMMDEKTLKEARLELPSALYVYHSLKKAGYNNEEVLKVLWESASKM